MITIEGSIRSLNDLEAWLADEIVKLRDGRTTVDKLRAAAYAAEKIISGVRLSLVHAKITGEKPINSFLNTEEYEDTTRGNGKRNRRQGGVCKDQLSSRR